VLEEGVTDREGLLHKPLSYERVARALGLEGQAAIETYLEEMDPPPDEEWPDVRHADVDLSEFHPDTITWLEWTTEIWSGADPAAAVLELFRRYSEDPARWSVIGKDVIERRNVHLVDEIRGALVEYDRVIVPWGALHQPFIQYAVLEMGFAPVEASYHPLASWGTMAAAVWPAITRSEDAPR
jgi:hypothetical protein